MSCVCVLCYFSNVNQVATSQINMNDNALEELSLAREPRQRGNGKDSTAIADNLPKFSEWAAGRQSTLDTDTLNKHVKQMVEVFYYNLQGMVIILVVHSINRLFSVPMTPTTQEASALRNLKQFPAIFRLWSAFLYSIKMSMWLVLHLHILKIGFLLQ